MNKNKVQNSYFNRPEVHGVKLKALLRSEKLPAADKPMVKTALEKYDAWINEMNSFQSEGDGLLQDLVRSVNQYKFFIEYDLIYCSKEDFLYRSKGQTKLDNTILEEFLPWLIDRRLVPGIKNIPSATGGPQKSFSGLSFGPFSIPLADGGMNFKEKDQDFTIGRKIFLKASPNETFEGNDIISKAINVAYFVAELKTNLDKTMFQEAAATSHELKTNVTGSTYLLLCEWLDMPPIDTRQTDIDEAIILRKAKRLPSNQRSSFATSKGRKKNRDSFKIFLEKNPLSIDSFRRLIEHLKHTFPENLKPDEATVLQRGYF